MFSRLTALLVPAVPGRAGWRLRSNLYAALCGVLAGGFETVLTWRRAGLSGEGVLDGIPVAIVVGVSVRLAFAAAHRLSEQRGQHLLAILDGAEATPPSPDLGGGWSALEHAARALRLQCEQRDTRIAELEHALAFYQPLADDMPGLEMLFDGEGRLIWTNPALHCLTGYTREECAEAGEAGVPWVYLRDRPMMRDQLARTQRGEADMKGAAAESIEMRVQHRNGTLRWYACRWYPLRDAAGVVIGTRFSARDVQARKDAELKLLENLAALRRAQALKEHYLGRSNDERMRLGVLLDIVRLGILFIDDDHRVIYANQACADIWRLGHRDALMGVRVEQLVDQTRSQRADEEAHLRHVREMLHQGVAETRYLIQCVDGRVIDERSAIVRAADDGSSIGRVWIFEDISEQLRLQATLAGMAERDALTGAYNRGRFEEDFDRMLADAARHGDSVGLLCFGVDNFDEVVRHHGWAAGDRLLQRVATVSGSSLRRNELLFRTGPATFAVLLSRTSPLSMNHLVERMALRTRGGSVASEIDAELSYGMALTPEHGRDAAQLLRAATQARSRARTQGTHHWCMALPGEGEDEGYFAARHFPPAPGTLQ
ncbi:diguanylate cyclase domain-containing protein [Uliginosibacterium paludis]|uniref:Diguanylate cyclase n=1 Tax=Uliginosibacterium paludis TaxID=1615952 RepID=A0ABV2CVB6_9RHOO